MFDHFRFFSGKKWLFYLLAIFTITYYSFFIFSSGSDRSIKIAEKFSLVFQNRSLNLINYGESLLKVIATDSKGEESIIEQMFYNETFVNNEIGVFVKKNGVLLFWNKTGIVWDDTLSNSLNKVPVFVKLKNGYFLKHAVQKDSIEILLLDPVYTLYPFENSFLTNGFSGHYTSTIGYTISETPLNAFPITNISGEVSFYIKPTDSKLLSYYSFQKAFGFIVLLAILSVLYTILYLFYKNVPLFLKNKWFGFLAFIADLLIIQLLLRYLGHYVFDFQSELFQPVLYNSGSVFPSLGFLIIHLHALLFGALFLFRFSPSLEFTAGKFKSFIALIVLALSVQLILIFSIILADYIFFHSSVPLSFTEVYAQNIWSYLVFFAIGLLIIAACLSAFRLFTFYLSAPENTIIKTAIFFALLIINTFWSIQIQNSGWYLTIFITLYYIIVSRNGINQNNAFLKSSYIIILLIAVSSLMTYSIFKVNQSKSAQEQLLTLHKLSADTDPMFEFLFAETRDQILSDTLIHKWLNTPDDLNKSSESQIYNRIFTEYLKGYYERYAIEQTLCSESQQLIIQPENFTVNCTSFFEDLVKIKGKKSSLPDLYIIDDNVQGIYYLAVIKFSDTLQASNNGVKKFLFLEFYFKYIPEGLGYPELLIDESKGFTREFANYSFATYQNGSLVYKFGSYLYPTRLNEFAAVRSDFFNLNGYRHIVQESGPEKFIVVSKKTKTLTEIIAPFSYFFFIIGGLGLIVLIFSNHKYYVQSFTLTFRLKLQMLILASLLLSFVVIGISSTYYITDVYKSKNNDFLAEKTQSILIELEHKLKNDDLSKEGMNDYLHQLLLKFSLVFFSDINLFDLNGKLMASSRPEIYERGLISELMNPIAYRAMYHDNKLYYIQQEQIGNGKYLSSYIPFKDSRGIAVAYINLPFFARESEMRNEISSLVLAYINLFLLLTGLSVTMALLLSRRLTQPLEMIQQKMRLVRFDKVNEKIVWKGKDELGQLVNQYNTLLDQLEESVERLARSERESAWREMARQVAHEIKNPLTPMRLSVQYLEKAWNENDPDIELKLKNTTQTIISQIDTLSSIASAFSDFAKMPVNKPEQSNLLEIIKQTINLFDHNDNIRLILKVLENESFKVYADPANLSRIFTNILKNGIQAIGNKTDGLIEVEISKMDGHIAIDITDNGKGMSEEEEKKVFTPNFTTKSSGMGIGLSIVYNLVVSAGGSISFDTEKGRGTVFHVRLPSNDE
ncbi:MAG: HAMP domain-containing sensor histidine kinase [Bacteroidales bacterium]|nr:HAMP domain-containing sensor histidine kinase [Bacteroidales bacterium]